MYTACSKQASSIKLEENPPELPCEQVFWEAPTAAAWAAIPWQKTPPRGLPFLRTLSSLLTEAGRASIPFKRLDALSKRLLARCLGRSLIYYQEQMESSFSSILSADSARTARAQVSSSIMALYETVWDDMTQAINFRQTLRVAVAAHYSHMLAAGRTVDIVTKTARTFAAGQGLPSHSRAQTGIDPSSTHGDIEDSDSTVITAHFASDPVATREMAWHASQVFFLQRRYPFNSPHEPLSLFLAGLYLWAFAKFYVDPDGGSSDQISIQLDMPSFSSSRDSIRAREHWIRHGGRALIEGAGNACTSGATVLILSLAIDITQRLKVWGMAAKVSSVFSRMLQREREEHEARTQRVFR